MSSVSLVGRWGLVFLTISPIDRDDRIQELQDRLESVQQKHSNEARGIERGNQEKLNKMEQNKRELEENIDQLKETIRVTS